MPSILNENNIRALTNVRHTEYWGTLNEFRIGDPVLFNNEIAIVYDTRSQNRYYVIGDGGSRFNELTLYKMIPVEEWNNIKFKVAAMEQSLEDHQNYVSITSDKGIIPPINNKIINHNLYQSTNLIVAETTKGSNVLLVEDVNLDLLEKINIGDQIKVLGPTPKTARITDIKHKNENFYEIYTSSVAFDESDNSQMIVKKIDYVPEIIEHEKLKNKLKNYDKITEMMSEFCANNFTQKIISTTGEIIIYKDIEYATKYGHFIMCGAQGHILKSTNAQNWSVVNTKNNITLNDVCFNEPNDTWFAVGGNSNGSDMGIIYKSIDNGDTWQEIHTPTSKKLNAMATDQDKLIVIIGEKGTLYVSRDLGDNWIWRDNPSIINDLNDIKFDNGIWVIVGNHGTILVSDDEGETWQSRPTSINENLKSVCFGGDIWIAVGENGTILYSINNAGDWNILENQSWEHIQFNKIRYNHGAFLFTADNGIIMTTIDALNINMYSARILDENHHLYGIGYGQGKWLIAADNNTYYTSLNLPKSFTFNFDFEEE